MNEVEDENGTERKSQTEIDPIFGSSASSLSYRTLTPKAEIILRSFIASIAYENIHQTQRDISELARTTTTTPAGMQFASKVARVGDTFPQDF